MKKLIFFCLFICMYPVLLFSQTITDVSRYEETGKHINSLKEKGTIISISTSFFNGYIIFKQGFGKITYDEKNILFFDTKRYKIVAGLGEAGFYSIESIESPGFYWMIQNKNIVLKKINLKNDADRKNATFKILPSFLESDDINFVTFESYAFPGTYVQNGWRELLTRKAENIKDMDEFKNETSFFIMQPLEIKYSLFQYLYIKPVVTIFIFLVAGLFFLFFLASNYNAGREIQVHKIKLGNFFIPVSKESVAFYAGFVVLFIIFLFAVLKTAWVSDDAYITFRTIDNFIHGYGLTWNIDERVQVYTHPLWMLLLAFFYFFTREIYLTSIIISIILTIVAVYIISKEISKTRLFSILALILFTYSKAFVEYSTSGLEYPLTFLCLAVFFTIYIKKDFNEKTLFLLSLIAALGILNRMDSFVLYLPPLVFAYIKTAKWKKGCINILLGFLPLICWELFSLFYYGFPFPNTAYAKLGTGISSGDLDSAGIAYFLTAIQTDPITIFIIVLGVILSYTFIEKRVIIISIGIIFYLIYIVKIGGCFMAGRYFTAPYLCALIILSQIDIKVMKWIYLPLAIAVLITGFFSLHTILFNEEFDDHVVFFGNRITNERVYYIEVSALVRKKDIFSPPDSQSVKFGMEMRDKGEKAVVVREGIGLEGFYAGPEIHIVDALALSDAFLARLSCRQGAGREWVIGHFRREIPEGYIETLENGNNMIKDNNLARFYDKLSILIKGNLFDLNRIAEIIKMNTGSYNPLLKDYNMAMAGKNR